MSCHDSSQQQYFYERLCLSSSICASGPPELAAPTLALPVPIDLKVENRESFTSLIPLRDDRPPDDGDIIITAVTLVLLCTDRLDLSAAAAGRRLPSRATLERWRALAQLLELPAGAVTARGRGQL